jgi:type III secretion protein R
MEHFEPEQLLAYLLFFGLMPFIIIGVTSFVKFSVVLGLLRNALGVQQIPSNLILYSMAVVLSLYVMLPVAMQAGKVIDATKAAHKPILSATNKVIEPFLDFTTKHTPAKERQFYEDSAKKLWGEKLAGDLTGKNATNLSKLIVIVPAFMTSELTKAFEIGFLLYLPFIVIDLVIANILLALGMSTLSPTTVSLPIKLLLFIGLNGWTRLFEALVMSYS